MGGNKQSRGARGIITKTNKDEREDMWDVDTKAEKLTDFVICMTPFYYLPSLPDVLVGFL